jgi:hypothetical protein
VHDFVAPRRLAYQPDLIVEMDLMDYEYAEELREQKATASDLIDFLSTKPVMPACQIRTATSQSSGLIIQIIVVHHRPAKPRLRIGH